MDADAAEALFKNAETKRALAQHKKAVQKLEKARRKLGKVLTPILKSENIEAIKVAIWMTPEDFQGKVRFYQAYLELQKAQKTKP